MIKVDRFFLKNLLCCIRMQKEIVSLPENSEKRKECQRLIDETYKQTRNLIDKEKYRIQINSNEQVSTVDE